MAIRHHIVDWFAAQDIARRLIDYICMKDTTIYKKQKLSQIKHNATRAFGNA